MENNNEHERKGFFENPARDILEVPEDMHEENSLVDPGYYERYAKRQATTKKFLSNLEKLLNKYTNEMGIHYNLSGSINTVGVDKGHRVNIERSNTMFRKGELVIGMSYSYALADLLEDPSNTREEAFWKLIKRLGLSIPSDDILRLVKKYNLGIGMAENIALDTLLYMQERLESSELKNKKNIIEKYNESVKLMFPKFDKEKVKEIINDTIILSAFDVEEEKKLRRGFYEYRSDGDSFFYADNFVKHSGLKQENKIISWFKGRWKKHKAPKQFYDYFGEKRLFPGFGKFSKRKISIGNSCLEHSLKVINDFAENTTSKYTILLLDNPLEAAVTAVYVNNNAYKDDNNKYVHIVPFLPKDPNYNLMNIIPYIDEKGFMK